MLLLVRHGQSEANVSGLLLGRSDSPLTELGYRQAELLGEALAARLPAPSRLLTSPLLRARQTAAAIADGLAKKGSAAPMEATVEERFVELDYGELDGTAPRDLQPGLWAGWRLDPGWRPPGGETLEEVSARVAAACDELAAEAAGHDVVVVSHVSPIKAAVSWALGCGPELSWRLSLSVASITRVATGGPGGPALVSFNETAHLGTAP
jgi:alpha-ribazole phosphatase